MVGPQRGGGENTASKAPAEGRRTQTLVTGSRRWRASCVCEQRRSRLVHLGRTRPRVEILLVPVRRGSSLRVVPTLRHSHIHDEGNREIHRAFHA
jgi:hypothetical protein